MELTISQIKLGQPYKLAGIRAENIIPFMVFLNRKKNPLVLELNPQTSTAMTYEMEAIMPTGKKKIYYIEEYKDSRYVIRTLFKASHFIISER
jgi:hypothetical protein